MEGVCFVCKTAAVGKNLYKGVGKTLPDMADELEKPFPEKCGLPACNSDFRQLFRSRINQLEILGIEIVNIITGDGRLAAHHAAVVTLSRDEQRIVIGLYVNNITHSDLVSKQ